ncbi:MAG: UdgX family uracil-DNA binding protein [Kofleriaceae bacterium]
MRSATAVPDLERWRDEARALLAADVGPADVTWTAPGERGLFDEPLGAGATTARVPARFMDLARDVVLHREAGSHALLYRLLWRITHGEPGLLDDAADRDVRAATLRAQQVRRDIHKMHAFVRFRLVGDHYVAWYAPDHHILARAATFFRDRFRSMHWAILTPDASVSWDGAMHPGPGVPRHVQPSGDEYEDMWRTYYAAIFNPARINPTLMRQHMPARFWPQLPESEMLPGLIAAASSRVDAMIDPATQLAARLAGPKSLPVLKQLAATCTACELCGPATQTVFGEGPSEAELVLVGEQPGDEEDLVGRPFVGPAGGVLDAALHAAGIPREKLYVTNAVKHFRFMPRGKKRIHQRPTADQVRACKPWLGAELQQVKPRVIVCLGSTAAQSLINSRFKVSEQRGIVIATQWADAVIATHHPAAILRVDAELRPRYEAELLADLRHAAMLLQGFDRAA